MLKATETKCRAADPSNCRYHGLLSRLENARTFNEYQKIRDQIEASSPKKDASAGIRPTVTVEDKTYVTASLKIDAENTYHQCWVKDDEGNTVAFLKIREGVERDREGQTVGPGVWLCSMEVNSDFRGSNASLAAIRQVKKSYKVNKLLAGGGSFSEQGLVMYQKLREHEMLTGETSIQLDPGVQEQRLYGTDDDYSFVKNWDEMVPEYSL